MDVGFNSKNKKDRKMYFLFKTPKIMLKKNQNWKNVDCLVIFLPLNTDLFKKNVCDIYMRLFSSQYFREGQSSESSYTKKASVYKPGFIWS